MCWKSVCNGSSLYSPRFRRRSSSSVIFSLFHSFAMSESQSIRTQYSTSPTLVDAASSNADDLDSIVRDLTQRVNNWAGADPTVLGQLFLHDTLRIRKGTQEKQFEVYLFEEAIICTVERKRKRIFGSALGVPHHVFGAKPTAPALTLKGRIFRKHIERISDTSTDDEWSLTVDMEGVKHVDSFMMIFSSQRSLKIWYSELSAVLSANPEKHYNPVKHRFDSPRVGVWRGSVVTWRHLAFSLFTWHRRLLITNIYCFIIIFRVYFRRMYIYYANESLRSAFARHFTTISNYFKRDVTYHYRWYLITAARRSSLILVHAQEFKTVLQYTTP